MKALLVSLLLATATLPDTPAGRIARELLDAVNGGDAAAQQAFVEKRLTRDREESLRALSRASRDSGGLDILDVRGDGDPLSVTVRTRRGNRIARLLLGVDPADSQHAVGFAIMPRALPETNIAWPEGDEAIAQKVRELAAKAAARDDFSGAVLLARGDRILLHEAWGVADRNHDVKIAPDSKFHVASVGKMFTATAIAQLIDQKKLTLDTTVAEVLPDYPNRDAAAKIRVRHLLSHTSGLGPLFDRPKWDRTRRYERQTDILPVFASEPLAFEPGTQSGYSNEGFIVLGAMIEKLTGLTWDEYVERNVWQRAGMTGTRSFSMDDVIPKMAIGYRRHDDDQFGTMSRMPYWTFIGYRGNACGGQYSTTLDLFRFLRALHGDKLMSPATREAMTTADAKSLANYTHGFATRPGAQRALGHTGGGGNSGIDASVWSIGEWSLVVLSNYEAATTVIERPVLELLTARPPGNTRASS